MEIKFIYVNNLSLLKEAALEWEQAKVLGLDLECENNLHHYGTYLSLIQISDGKKNWIVDALAIEDLSLLVKVLENPKVQKIFHDVSFDFRILNHELGCKPKNIFDTHIAASLLGKKELGLGSLLHNYLNVEKESKFQKADWTRRPLTKEMLEYAAKDTIYLIALRDCLIKELKDKNRLNRAEEEFAFLESKDYTYQEGGFEVITGLRMLSDQQRAILKRIYDLRERIAQKVDRPIHFIINNKKMLELVNNLPSSAEQWMRIYGVHPAVRNWAQTFYEETEKGKKEEYLLPTSDNKKFNPKQKEQFNRLEEVVLGIASELNIARHLIMNKEQMIEATLKGNLDGLRQWQRELVEKKEWKRG